VVENQLLADLVVPGDRVLEVGCHQGFYLPFLSKLVGPNGFVLGVDINPENVMIAQAQLVLNGLTGHCEVLHRAASASAEGNLRYSDSTNSMVVLSGEAEARCGNPFPQLAKIRLDFGIGRIGGPVLGLCRENGTSLG
jgi:SAM-dependent methyltransferase